MGINFLSFFFPKNSFVYCKRCQCYPGWSEVKNAPPIQETQVWFLGREVPWRRVWQPTAVSLSGESHGQRSLVGCSPWGHTTEHSWRAPGMQGCTWALRCPLQGSALLSVPGLSSCLSADVPGFCAKPGFGSGPSFRWWDINTGVLASVETKADCQLTAESPHGQSVMWYRCLRQRCLQPRGCNKDVYDTEA